MRAENLDFGDAGRGSLAKAHYRLLQRLDNGQKIANGARLVRRLA